MYSYPAQKFKYRFKGFKPRIGRLTRLSNILLINIKNIVTKSVFQLGQDQLTLPDMVTKQT